MRRVLAQGLLAACVTLSAEGAGAETAPLPDLGTCLARAVDHFEMELARARDGDAPDFAIVTRDRVQHCTVLAIVSCDRSAAPVACQEDLARELAVLRDAVRASLPAPEAVAGRDPVWSDGLYPVFWRIVHGLGAGPTCAGADAVYTAWCDARQAGLRLGEAVMLWQVARVLGAGAPAVEAGWVGPPPPIAPVPRPGRGG